VLIAPDRLRLVVARLGAYSLTGLLVGLVTGAVALGIGLALLGGEPAPGLSGSDYLELGGGGLIDVMLAAAIGVGVGTLVRNQVAAVVGALVWLSILEPLTGVIDDSWSKFTVGNTLNRVGLGGTDDMGFAGSVLVLLVWALVWCVAGALVDRRRDVD
jgi:ABC-2 type transport system permease protein